MPARATGTSGTAWPLWKSSINIEKEDDMTGEPIHSGKELYGMGRADVIFDTLYKTLILPPTIRYRHAHGDARRGFRGGADADQGRQRGLVAAHWRHRRASRPTGSLCTNRRRPARSKSGRERTRRKGAANSCGGRRGPPVPVRVRRSSSSTRAGTSSRWPSRR